MDAELYEFYLGSAYLPLNNLRYLESNSSPENCTGCCFTDAEHNLPTLIKNSDLENILKTNKVDSRRLHDIADYPKLSCIETIVFSCLHGDFRIKHGKTSQSALSWWPVDLYSSDISYEISNRIRKFYQSHKPLCDGEIYLRIRYYQRHNAVEEASAWLSKLSKSKQRNINQILRKDSLRVILDELEEYRGLWQNFQISSLPPILSWRCYEEVTAYLTRILVAWKAITLGNSYWCDVITVRQLQGLAPMWSIVDQAKAEKLFRSRTIFSRASKDSRKTIEQIVVKSPDIIPSFCTFYKHTKMIGPPMLALRQLLPERKAQPSMYEAFRNCFRASYCSETSLVIQHDEDHEQIIQTKSEMAMKLAYLQLVLAAFRQSEGIPTPKRGNDGESPGWLVRLAHNAHRLGYDSDMINQLRQCNPEISDIRLNMRREKPETDFWVNQESFSQEVYLRHDRQRIFERRGNIIRFSMTDEDFKRPKRNVSHHKVYLPVIEKVLFNAERGQYLSEFGKFVLILSMFFGKGDARSWLDTTMRLMGSPTQSEHSVPRSKDRSGTGTHFQDDVVHSNPQHVSSRQNSEAGSYTHAPDGLDNPSAHNKAQSPQPNQGSITFIQIMHPPIKVLSCSNNVKAVKRTLSNLQDSGFNILLTAVGEPQHGVGNAEARLRKVRPNPRVILNLYHQLHDLVIYCCPSALYLGQRVKDLPPAYRLIKGL